jgi:hypothetical protein
VEVISGGEALCAVSPVRAVAEEYVETKRKDFEEKVMIEKERKREIQVVMGLMIVYTIGLLFLLFFCGGCAEVGLRFAPSQAIKANAELTNQLARKVNTNGTDPQSPASKQLVSGTEASLNYTGRPQQAPDPDQFNTINDQAITDANQRPDMSETMDGLLELGIGLTGLLGGTAGFKIAQNLRRVHAQAKGFTEVVTNNELFKQLASPELWEQFKRAQASQTAETRKLVAQTSTEVAIRKTQSV